MSTLREVIERERARERIAMHHAGEGHDTAAEIEELEQLFPEDADEHAS